jgi:large subunit ribosomal protein L25
MADVNLSGELRTDFGKGFARRIRMEKKVPAVIYSKGNDPIHFILDSHDTEQGLRHSNALFEIELDGKKKLAIAKDVQKHVFKPVLYHVDFIEIVAGQKIVVEIPIKVVGTLSPHTLNLLEAQTVEVLADPLKIPEDIEVDITGKEAGDTIHAEELILPEGTELKTLGDTTIVIFQEEATEESYAAAEEAAAEGTEAAEGEATAEGDAPAAEGDAEASKE